MARKDLPVLTQVDSRIPSTCAHFHPTAKSLQHTGVHGNNGYELHKDVSCYSVCLNPVMGDSEQPDRVANCQCPTAHNDCMEYTPSPSQVLGYVSLDDGTSLTLTKRNILNGLEVYEVIRFADGALEDAGGIYNPDILFSASVHGSGDNAYSQGVEALKEEVKNAGANPEKDITWEDSDDQDTKSSYLEMVTSS